MMKIYDKLPFAVGILFFSAACGTHAAVAHAFSLKLPYAAGQAFTVVQGYDSLPTHIGKDYYAIDFSQDGCAAYGAPALAATDGEVILAAQNGYNGGYGTEVMIDHGGGVVSRYAHLIEGSIKVEVGQVIPQGTIIGAIGNTGLVEGLACGAHPGTHIHFALDVKNPDGTYTALKPEPISGYMDIRAGLWYLSDNEIAPIFSPPAPSGVGGITTTSTSLPNIGVNSSGGGSENTSVAESSSGLSGGVGILSSPDAARTSTTMVPEEPAFTGSAGVSTGENISSEKGTSSSTDGNSGGDIPSIHSSSTEDFINSSSTQPSETSSTQPDSTSTVPTISSSTPLQPPGMAAGENSIGIFDTTTIAADFSWQAPANASGGVAYDIFDVTGASSTLAPASSSLVWFGTSTDAAYPIPADGTAHVFTIQAEDSAGNVAFATTSVTSPDWLGIVQPDDSAVSYPSWYEDNWFDLGTGFYGTIRTLTLEGHVDDPDYFASHVWLQEFLDPAYTELNQVFTISDDAPFTATSTKVSIGGLNIPLQPDKYYRLATYQDYQNRSIIFAGTDTTGTAMWNEYIYSEGRVEHQYPFYPYLAWTFIPDYPALQPPGQVATPTIKFDAANTQLDISWPATTDPDTTSTLLTYEIGVSTSSAIGDNAWQSVGKNLSAVEPVTFGNSYLIGIRAVDDLGNVSAPAIITWNFPADYEPLPSQTDHSQVMGVAPQKFTLLGPTLLSEIGLWTAPTGYGQYCCSESYLELYADNNSARGNSIATSSPIKISQYDDAEERWYPFTDLGSLPAGNYWFAPFSGPSPTDDTIIYGSGSADYFQLQTATGP